MRELDALFAFAAAGLVATALTPLVARLAFRLGAVDEPRARGLSERTTPLLGGFAILGGVLVAGFIWLPNDDQTRAILVAAALIALIGGLDDIFDLHPSVKLVGQIGAALIPVLAGVTVDRVTLPFVGSVGLGEFSGVLTVIGLVAVMNVVNLTDGVDGLAAGVCTIGAATFAVLAFDLGKADAAVLAALTAGAALGFLLHNFHPASIFMGDSGSNLLGLLLGCAAVQGTLKTNAVVALILPLLILAVPFLDTGFVVAKRIKYRQPIYRGDAWHFHHRLANIGFSQRRTVLYLYGWTLSMAGLALAMRFIPYSDNHGHLNLGWSLVLAGCGVVVLGASIYLIYVLEIFKFRGARKTQLLTSDPETTEYEIDQRVVQDLETGQFACVEELDPPVDRS